MTQPVKFVQRYNNEGWTIQNRIPFFIRCCDCKLIHKMVVVAKAGKHRKGSVLGIAAARDNRRTAIARKKKNA